MMRHWREREFERGLNPATQRYGLEAVGVLRQAAAALPRGDVARHAGRSACSAARKGRFGYLPLAGGWTKHRDMPAPEGRTFMQQMRGRAGAAEGLAMSAPRRHPRQGARRAAGGGRRRCSAPARWPSGWHGAAQGRHPGARPIARGRARRAVLRQWPKAVRDGRAGRRRTKTVPKAVADYLRQRNLPASLRMGARRAAGRDAVAGASERCRSGRAPRTATTRSASAMPSAAIAETGTLVMVSGADNPTTINFLPEHHIVVRRRSRHRRRPRSGAGRRSATQFGKGKMPRTRQPDLGPVTLRRHRAEDHPRRARPARPAHHRGGRLAWPRPASISSTRRVRTDLRLYAIGDVHGRLDLLLEDV